jgi:hypothetical protein
MEVWHVSCYVTRGVFDRNDLIVSSYRLRAGCPPFAGLASKLAEELCWQIQDNPVFRFHLVREGAVGSKFREVVCLQLTGSCSGVFWGDCFRPG